MSSDPVSVCFSGYWRDLNVRFVPKISGVYAVYACRDIPQANTVAIRSLIYIGESNDVRERLSNHEGKQDWRGYLRPGEELCYATAPVPGPVRESVEAELIRRHQPPANVKSRASFPYQITPVVVSASASVSSGKLFS